jgi:alpha-L-rhamnosidase
MIKSLFISAIFGFSLLQNTAAQPQSVAVELKTEHLINPIGLDTRTPLLSWRIDDKREGALQSGFRVLVSKDSLELTKGSAKIWDSGWKASEQNSLTYFGEPLTPFTKYFWRVETGDQAKVKSLSAIARFETGMMTARNWKGAWITDVDDIQLKPAPYFRKVFQSTKVVQSARAYIAVAGLYELYINGKKVGSHRLDPMYTRFDRRTLYVTHDVTSLVQSGKNCVGVLLGNGWYNHQSIAVWDFHKAPWRARPTFCLDLRITYTDGSVETISSGKDWKTALSPIVFNSIYTGEHHDARKAQPGWNTAAFDDSQWKEVRYRAAPSNNIVAQVLHPIRNVEVLKPVSVKKFNDTTYVFDLGRNFSGISEIRVSGPSGAKLTLKHGERLYPNGHVDISNIDYFNHPPDNSDPFQTDIYILSGKGEETFSPHFNYKGFRYVEVTSNVPVALNQQSLTGYFMHSDVPNAGKINSSNPVINKIMAATNASYLSNLFGYPTDCPQREKNGWTGDAHIAIETALYGYDGITIYEKWLADHRDEQQPNGVLPAIIPTAGWGYEWANGVDWTSTMVIIPWNVYLFYGDTEILADNYENMRRYVDYIDSRHPSGLTSWGLGDWIPVKSKASIELTSTCYFYADALILSKIAAIMEKPGQEKHYAALAEKIKNAFNEKYLNREAGLYSAGLQTELSAPLFWGLVPDDMKSKVAANLAKRVEADNFHLDVGLLGTKVILNALTENGYPDVAYKVAAQETFPSWGWWIKNGATTLYENWNSDANRDLSMNHIMFGEIGAWMYKALGGIRPDPGFPGFKRILFTPTFPQGLNQFEAEHNGPYGLIKSSWVRAKKRISYTVVVPPNSTGMLSVPPMVGLKLFYRKKLVTSTSLELPAGTHQFEWR